MFSCRAGLVGAFVVLAFLAVLLAPPPAARASEMEASTAPQGAYLIKIYPKFYYTSAYFDGQGKARNLPDVSGLLYFELPIQVQYGITGRLSIGALLPLGWTYEELDVEGTNRSRLAIREMWVSGQYRALTFPLIVSVSTLVKIPLADKEPWEDGLRIGDGQVDVFPVAHFEYDDQTRYWYVQMSTGYKYRFERRGTKLFDEIRFYGQGGYELFPDLRMRFYLFADLTKFVNGEFPGGGTQFFQHKGDLHNFGYGVSLWPRPTFRVEISTGGDWSGTNQYRGIRWELGFTKIIQ